MGLQADLAENGKQALELIFKNEYDVVLMDCHMPELDGFQTLVISGADIRVATLPRDVYVQILCVSE